MLSLPGSKSAINDVRIMLTADLFIATDSLAGEKVTNGIVTRSLTSWISDEDNVRQVCIRLSAARLLQACCAARSTLLAACVLSLPVAVLYFWAGYGPVLQSAAQAKATRTAVMLASVLSMADAAAARADPP